MSTKSLRLYLLVILVAAIGAALAPPWLYAGQQASPGASSGLIGADNGKGITWPAKSTTIYFLYDFPEPAGPMGHEQVLDTDHENTAGREFISYMKKLAKNSTDLKPPGKSRVDKPNRDDTNQLATLYLQFVDKTLEHLRNWLRDHPDRAWEMRTTAPDERGLWSIDELRPGVYLVVARGSVSENSAEWEATLKVPAGRGVNLTLVQPSFILPD
jgi:hypothetical protein